MYPFGFVEYGLEVKLAFSNPEPRTGSELGDRLLLRLLQGAVRQKTCGSPLHGSANRDLRFSAAQAKRDAIGLEFVAEAYRRIWQILDCSSTERT
jgi:hypothetical protein